MGIRADLVMIKPLMGTLGHETATGLGFVDRIIAPSASVGLTQGQAMATVRHKEFTLVQGH